MQILQKNENIQKIQGNLIYSMRVNTGIEATGPRFVISREFSNMLVL